MTLRMVQGNLLLVGTQLANAADCCCPPPIPWCCDNRSVNYWQLVDVPLGQLGPCCDDILGTYFPNPSLTTACSYGRVVNFSAPTPCATPCAGFRVFEPIGPGLGFAWFTYYWAYKSIEFLTEIDDGTGYLGTGANGLTIQAKTTFTITFYRYRQQDGAYVCETITDGTNVSVDALTQCPFFQSQFPVIQPFAFFSPRCDPPATIRLDTFYNIS